MMIIYALFRLALFLRCIVDICQLRYVVLLGLYNFIKVFFFILGVYNLLLDWCFCKEMCVLQVYKLWELNWRR